MTPARLVLPQAVRAAIFDHARREPDIECCGLLIGTGEGVVVAARVHPTRNASCRPQRRFEIDPQEQFDLLRSLRGSAERIIGHYHSHPGGPARPSEHDRAMAHDPEAIWLVVALPDDLGAFVCAEGQNGFVPLPLEIQ